MLQMNTILKTLRINGELLLLCVKVGKTTKMRMDWMFMFIRELLLICFPGDSSSEFEGVVELCKGLVRNRTLVGLHLCIGDCEAA
jgi:hypothetical protein